MLETKVAFLNLHVDLQLLVQLLNAVFAKFQLYHSLIPVIIPSQQSNSEVLLPHH